MELTIRVDGKVIETPTTINRFDPEVVCEIVRLEPVPVPVLTASIEGAAGSSAGATMIPVTPAAAPSNPAKRRRRRRALATAATDGSGR
jgi:hypothetical protein